MKQEMTMSRRFQEWLRAEPKKRYLVLAFVLPCLILGTAFAFHRVFPFGDRQILVTDFWQQYYPFLSDLWHKLRSGSSLLWSWSNGIGTNFLGLISYYLASPLNLLIALFPHGWLREVVTLLLVAKIGMAGLSCALYLKYHFKRNDISITLFSLFYALCAFTLGYYWNIMWFDTFALLPLVILGVRALVKEGKYKTYVIALALSFAVNYYIGFFTCLFVAIMFFVFCISERVPVKQFFKKLMMIAGFSLLALAMTAIISLPAFATLGNSYSAVNKFPTEPKLYESFMDIIGNFIAFAESTAKEGLPNIYSGMLSILLMAVFALSNKIRLREKIAYLGVLVFLIVSCNLNILNYIWHGFHFTNMIPYRFSFLISFLLVIMAYRAFTLIDDMDRLDYIGMGIVALWVLWAAFAGPQNNYAVLGSAALSVAYILIFILYRRGKLKKSLFTGFLSALVLVEVCGSAGMGVSSVGTTTRTGYPSGYNTIQEALAQREGEETGFARTEFVKWYSVNDPSMYGYNGISLFSSTVNVSTTSFLDGIGLPGWRSGNRYGYAETSPLTNGFMNLKHLISRNGEYMDNAHWLPVGEAESAILLENRYYLPFGFMVSEGITGYETQENGQLFEAQNSLYEKSTGIKAELYAPLDIIHVGHKDIEVGRTGYGRYSYTVTNEEEGFFKWNYEAPRDGMLYAYLVLSGDPNVEILKDGETIYTVNQKRPYIFCCGEFKAGEIMSLKTPAPEGRKTGTVQVYVSMLDDEAFEVGYETLADEVFTVTRFEDRSVAGTVEAASDGLLYTSIPYEKGWTAYVDGVETEIVPLNGSMAMVPLTAGAHEVEFRFMPAGFLPGLGITGLALAVFVLIVQVDKRRPKPVPVDPEPEPEEEIEAEEDASDILEKEDQQDQI